MDIKPSEIYYSQDSINKYFDRRSSHRTQTIGQTLDQVINGNCSITSIPRISILKLQGNHKWFSVDNRRLWVFKQLERLGYIDTIRVDCTVYNYNRHGRKITTNNGGVSIRIRGDGQPGGDAHTLPDNCYDQMKRKIEKDDQHKKISGNRDVHQRFSPFHINNTSQPTVRSSCEDREPLEYSAPQEKQSDYQSNARQYNTERRNLTLLQKYHYTSNFPYSSSSDIDRKAEISKEQSFRGSDRGRTGFSESFRKMYVSDQVKESCNRSDSSNKDDVGTNVVTVSSRYPFNTKNENDADSGYAVTGQYAGSYRYTTNRPYSSSYIYRKANTSNEQSLSGSDRESAVFSNSFRNMHVSDTVKVSNSRSHSSNTDDPGPNSATNINRYHFDSKHEDDAGIKYVKAYTGLYKSRFGQLSKTDTIGESESTTSKYKHHETLRAECPNPAYSHQKPFPNEVQIVQSKQVKHTASHNTAYSKVKTNQAQSSQHVNPSVAVTKSADPVEDERILSIKGIYTSVFGSNNARSTPVEISHRTDSRQSYITEEQVERNMKRLLYRQWFKELLPDTWSTYSCKSSD